MAKINVNFIFWKHNKRRATFTVEDVATLDGCEVYWAMSESPGSEALISKSSETTPAGILTSGKIARVQMLEADTATIEPGSYYHELMVIDTAGNPITASTGNVDLREVTIVP